MKSPTFPLLLIAALALAGSPAHAEKADRDKPMNLDAGTLRYDLKKQVMVYGGGVVVTKGTIVIRGGTLEVREDPQGNQFATVSAEAGKVASFRQKRDGLDEFIEGEGESIEYDGRADTVKFVSNAQLRRYRGATLSDEFSGQVILYNNGSEVFSIDGAPVTSGAARLGGRIRAMLTPRPVADAPVDKAAAVPPLRSSGSLGGEKK
jgi:lipopolysaccharide export system protein LptA